MKHMTMVSPVDPTSRMVRETLSEGLVVLRCRASGGIWVRPSAYWGWLEKHDALPTPNPTDAGEDVPTEDSGAGKRCPEDGHFLIRHRVGHGLDFHLDRCGHCGGIWLDPGEWEAMRQKGLHEKLHFVFSSAWQARVREQERRDARTELLKTKLGESDYEELKRIAEWIASSPKRHEMMAYLREASASQAP